MPPRDYDKCRAAGHEVEMREVLVASQTHWSPAEYDEVPFCTVCDYDEPPERDWDIERDIRDGY